MMENSQKDNIIKPTKSKKKKEAPEWLFANIAEASKNARKIYFLYIGFLFYCAFTVFGTPDRYIILNEKIKMPILNIDVPLIGFMLMAPLVAIFLFVYLQMYLGRLKWLIDLSTNYAPIERGRLYPWMLNFPKDPERGFSKGLQKIIIKFSLWGLLPLVLGLFACVSLKTHNSLICYIDGIAMIIGAITVLIFWCRYERVQKKVLKFFTKNLGKLLLTLTMFLFGFVFLFYLIPMSLNGDLFRLDLSYEKLITELKPDYPGIYWGHFMRAHLEGALLISTILERADLRDAYLQGATMNEVILREANLSGADLSGADLSGADLYGTDLTDANLNGADLSGAKNLSVGMLKKARSWLYAFYDGGFLTKLGLPSDHNARVFRRDFSEYNLIGADLSGADLTDAFLSGADLTDAFLSVANLSGADLTDADLSGAILTDAFLYRAILSGANLYEAILSGADLVRADLSGAILYGANLNRANLHYANLSGADLYEANLSGADLSGADLNGADLYGASLYGANLNGAIDLTIEQLSKVKTLYKAKLDPELEKEIKEKYPGLLEKPKEDKDKRKPDFSDLLDLKRR